MANTTFSGPVRSEGGFEQVTKSATTGDFTTNLDIDASGNLITTGHVVGQTRIYRQTTAVGWNDGAYAPTVSQRGSIFLLDKDEATTVTLPAVTSADLGATFTFIETVASNNARAITTVYDNDYFVGGLNVGTTAAENGAVGFIVAAATDRILTFDDDLVNGMGALGSHATFTAILTGNVGAGGGAKLVWAATGSVGSADPNGNGTAIFT
tara:strand:- start:190 stop:819 length:630 start_codon:yes stop_codon:yes gene_type:complete